jgi:hypothetical protein
MYQASPSLTPARPRVITKIIFEVTCSQHNLDQVIVNRCKLRSKYYKQGHKIYNSNNRTVGDIPNGYTSDVVLNPQDRVAHQGGMADCLPGGPVVGETMAVLDAGAHGRSEDRPMVGCLVVHA